MCTSEDEIKLAFIEFLVSNGMLKFGEFKYKSGRIGPYFCNISVERGDLLEQLVCFYAQVLVELETIPRVIFGPSYKGIPLCTSLSEQISGSFFCFNRKEAKDHGEGGSLVGHKLTEGDEVVIVEDVTTSGSSIYEVAPIIESCGAKLAGVLTAVDRMEVSKDGTRRASTAIIEDFDCWYASIVTVREILDLLHGKEVLGKVWIDDAQAEKMEDYFRQYAPDALK